MLRQFFKKSYYHHFQKIIHYLIQKPYYRNFHDIVHFSTHHIETAEHSFVVIAMAISFVGNSIFAGATTSAIPSTDQIIYPVKEVTTLPCRQQMKNRDELESNCKVPLWTIVGGDYDRFRDTDITKNTPYKSIYTTLRGATYNGQRDMDKGDHAGVDIASAKWTPLYAVAHGVVTFAGEQAWYGNVVKLMFRHNGKTYHAIYGHMDTITVQKWDILEQWKNIGTIWNSGETFGALWGNHVHFEINKDNKGYPLFYYAGCPALVTDKKSFTEITNNGLCREYREKAQLDPIIFIEKSRAKMVSSLTPVGTVANTESMAHPSASENKTDNKIDNKITITPSFIELKKLDPSKLTQEAIQFVRERDIQLIVTNPKVMSKDDKGILQVFVTQKWSAKPFNGPLPTSFIIISPSNGIQSEIQSINYLNNGVQSITFSATKKGNQKLAVTFWSQTIGVIDIKSL